MDFAPAHDVETLPFDGPLFSVCSLVTSDTQYQRMLTSFDAHGFNAENSEFILVDNRTRNVHEAYAGLNAMLARASGRYIVCCHQDVELIGDGAVELQARLEALTKLDPRWAVAGNSGFGQQGRAARISDPYGDDQNEGSLPSLVFSLDENLLILNAEKRIGFSADLAGFHLYGTDICMQAELQGLTAYVIDFHLRHHSRGKVDAGYFECLRGFEAKYGKAFRSRRMRTSVKTAYVTSSAWQAFWWTMKKRRRERLLRRRT